MFTAFKYHIRVHYREGTTSYEEIFVPGINIGFNFINGFTTFTADTARAEEGEEWEVITLSDDIVNLLQTIIAAQRYFTDRYLQTNIPTPVFHLDAVPEIFTTATTQTVTI